MFASNLYEELASYDQELLIDLTLLLTLGRRRILGAPTNTKFLLPRTPTFSGRAIDYGMLPALDHYYSFFLSRKSTSDPNQLRDNLDTLISHEALGILSEVEPDSEVTHLLDDALPNPRDSKHPHTVSFIHGYLEQALTHAKLNGLKLLMRSRRTISLLREHISIIELAHRADQALDQKKELSATLFGYPGGQTLKLFLAGLTNVAALVEPILGFPGLLLFMVDP